MDVVLKVRRHYDGMALPARAHPNDAGFDLTAMKVEPLRPNVFAFDTGISVEAAPGYYCEVVPRSSIVNTDFVLANGVGVIDPDFRGPIRVVLRYLGSGEGNGHAEALLGKRIAQLLVHRLEPVRVEPVGELGETSRGGGGFGSTGE